ncbi:putative Cell surface protein [Seiridium cardinale]|uniref:Cell surface protein n=1 Tax=Seiridium cardinale TaxID=138064 RepID=A0ABR2Y7X3_9PEZI
MSGIVNKVKEALHHDKDKSTHEQPTGTHGTHDSRVANAADPRIDSDRDHRANPTTTTTHGEGLHSSRPHEGVGSTGLGSGGAYGHEQPSGTHGPHSSRAANVADPRIDSDNDHRGAPGATGYGSSTTHNTHTGAPGATGYGSSTTHTGGLGSTGTHNTYSSGAPEGVHGPHGSRAANAVDPRVDSDRDHRGAPGTTGFGSSTTHNTHAGGVGSTGNYGSSTTHGTSGLGSTGGAYGSGAPEGTHGPHGSRAANAADPRIDSDRDHRGAPGSNFNGPASNTAGPHKSDALNKADPRVDSDLDGSKTYGGNKTHQY